MGIEGRAGYPLHSSFPPDGGFPPTNETAEYPLENKVALITGGSRDIGAELVKRLARKGVIGIAGYHNKAKRADGVAGELHEFGDPFTFVPGDITTDEGIQSLIDALPDAESEEGQLDIVILNAASADRELNVVANNKLIDAVLPRMKKGGKIVFMQSTPGHFNGILDPINLVPNVYKGVASTKDEAERSIADRITEFQEKEISLVRIVAPAVPNSSNVTMFKNKDAEAAAKFGEIATALGLPAEMSKEEVADIVIDVLERNTGTDYIELFGPYMDGRHELRHLYGEPAIYVDTKTLDTQTGRMIVTPDRTSHMDDVKPDDYVVNGNDAFATYLVTSEHSANHFKEESGLPLLLPGHKQIRVAVDTLSRVAETQFPGKGMFRMRSFESVTFSGVIKPGDEITVYAHLENYDSELKSAQGKVFIFVASGEERKQVAEINGLVVEKFVGLDRDEPIFLEDQIIEAAAQSAALEVLADPNTMPLFQSIGETYFYGPSLRPGDVLIMQSSETNQNKRSFAGGSIVTDQAGELVAKISQMQAVIMKKNVAQKLLQ